MKKIMKHSKLETGQMIPLVVMMMLVIIGMVALILDGGSIMSNRRTAQAAADSAALAGAQRACAGHSDAAAVAEYYAFENSASSVQVTVSGYNVTAKVIVENPSFFATVLGEDTLLASAEATAGCYGVRGNSVVPLAWRCYENSGGPFNPEYGCQMQTLSWDKVVKPLVDGTPSLLISDFEGNNEKAYHLSDNNIVDNNGIPPSQIYVIMDTDKLCVEDGGDVTCDLDGDGKRDLQLGGDRGWLYLTADTSNIDEWLTGIDNGLTLHPHQWLSGKSGVATSVYIKMISLNYPGKVTLIPVYNELCENNPLNDSSCVARAHAAPYTSGVDDFSEMKNSGPYYHIIAFQPFYVTCVDKKGDCPGFKHAQTLNKKLKDGPVVEGFFLHDVKVSPDASQGCEINLGNCTISLSN